MDGQSHIYQAFTSGEWMLMVALLLITFLIGILLMWVIWGSKVRKLQSVLFEKKNILKGKNLELDRLNKNIEDLKLEVEKSQKNKTQIEKELVKVKAEATIKENEFRGSQAQVNQLKENIQAQAITIETLQNQLHDFKSGSRTTRSPRSKTPSK
ncbi:MAG: hypothetical protein R2769_15765 [Saprospiraceae bacterium]